MEDFVLVVLSLAVLWLFIRTRGRAADRKKLAEHNTLIGLLHQRVVVLEEAAKMAAPATQQPAAEPVVREAPVPVEAMAAPVEEPVSVVESEAPLTAAAAFAPQISSAPFVTPPSEAPLSSQPPTFSQAETQPQEIVLPAPSESYVSSPAVEASVESEGTDAAAPVPVQAPAPPPKRHVSFEERFGQNWLNKLGIVAVVIGMAGGLGLLMRTIGPAGRSAIGMVISLAILGGGILLERKQQYRVFARALIGGGWALTFFVTFALYHVQALQVLQSQTVDLVLMLIVAAAMVMHSLRYKSQVVTSLAFLLAFVTVGISHVTLFSLVAGALLAVGLVYVVARESWFGLGLAGLVGVYFNHYLWLLRMLPDGGQPGHPFPEFVSSAALLLFYWLLFRVLYVMCVPKTRRQELVSSFSAILNSVGLMLLLKFQSSHPEWAFRGLLVLGIAEFVFAFVARRRWRGAFIVLSTLASALLLAAVPFRFSGGHWTLLWLLEAEVLFIAGLRMKEVVFRRLGMIAGFVTTAQLLVTGVAPMIDFRQAHADTTHHLHLTITLLSAAVLFWFNSEFCKRRWSLIVDEQIDHVGLGVTSYMALIVATLALWVFFPGAWTVVAWLVAALVLAWLADRLTSGDLAAQSDILAVCAVIRAAMVNFTLTDHWHGLSLRAITVGISGVLLYVAMRRRTPALDIKTDYIAPAYSWAAAGLLGVMIYFCVPVAWTIVAWLPGALVLAFFADRPADRSPFRDFATQADILAACAVVRAALVNFTLTDSWHGLSLRAVTIGLSVALLYLMMRRRTPARGITGDYIAPAYSWAAAALFGTMLWYVLEPIAVAVGWAVFALLLFEVGTTLRRSYFRYQGYVLLAASFVRLWISNLNVGDASHFLSPRLYTVVPLIAAYFWVYWRLHGEQREGASALSGFEQKIGTIAPWLGTIAVSALIYFEVRPDWVGLAGALFALVLLAVGWWLQRPLFVAQALVLLLAAAVREGMFHLFSPEPLATAFTSSRVFCVGATCVVMLLALPLAFRVRGQLAERAAATKSGWRSYTLFRPEQPFFFIPFVLLAVLLFIQLQAGMITTGWVVLGLLTFLLALMVGERSYRLAGLSLLMLGVCKIILYDIWHLSLIYRCLTLFVMGIALLLVSFLYSRYKETILKFL
jgi:hypothetical protein